MQVSEAQMNVWREGLQLLLLIGMVVLLGLIAVCFLMSFLFRKIDDWEIERAAMRYRQSICDHSRTNGIRVYTRPIRRLFRKQIWWVCPGCGAREVEVRRKHA